MIFFLTTARNNATIRFYLEGYGAPWARRIVPVTYETFLSNSDTPPGTYCFADIELLSDDARAAAGLRWEELASTGHRLLNHPVRSMRRYELLRTLHDDGLNRFRVHRPGDETPEYPVFLRRENDHGGRRSQLLHNKRDLDDALRSVEACGERVDEYIVVEFCDTSDAQGVYRKYGVFVVGQEVIARHLMASVDWQVKEADILTDELVAEERNFVKTNPHAEEVRRLFERARIAYGRIDYSIVDDTLQVWEINTNPQITLRPMSRSARARTGRTVRRLQSVHRASVRRRRLRAPVHRMFAENLAAAWASLERDEQPGRSVAER